ncbi:hypothetical protein K503DRAFT_805998 [Rhizopogon vinicolor AM-OR11-026]|uniref:Uncharacterized protein n=1 Tax=Rhizopogon vinicolor AM-OR11-026 TaxID=1314800 RepID=A0A1B7MG19_9AGAM|nr:hypothetical protein K503DRAFT_805998 [Rhizopogon vinicolor AM-OR11-026]
MSDEPEVQLEVPPPKCPPMDHTRCLLPPKSRRQQEDNKDLEHDGAPLPRFKRQCHLTHNDDEDVSLALKSRCRIVYTVDDEDEYNSTPPPKPVKHRHHLPNYEEDDEDSEIASASKHR